MSTVESIVRTCKNAAGDIIAVQTITVTFKPITSVEANGLALVTANSLSSDRFRRGASIKLSTKVSYKSGGSRTISSIDTTGGFSSTVQANNDISTVVYAGVAPTNDVTVPVTAMGGVFKVGDTV